MHLCTCKYYLVCLVSAGVVGEVVDVKIDIPDVTILCAVDTVTSNGCDRLIVADDEKWLGVEAKSNISYNKHLRRRHTYSCKLVVCNSL